MYGSHGPYSYAWEWESAGGRLPVGVRIPHTVELQKILRSENLADDSVWTFPNVCERPEQMLILRSSCVRLHPPV